MLGKTHDKPARNGEFLDPRVLQRGDGVGEMKSCCRHSHAQIAVRLYPKGYARHRHQSKDSSLDS